MDVGLAEETEHPGPQAGWRRTLHAYVPKASWGYTLGAATLAAAILLAISGVLLTLYYEPAPTQAHQSVQYITYAVPFGWLIRGLHHWSANALILLAVAHMVRVILHGAYKYPRQVTWLSGVVMLLVLFAFAFTGSLLPWDQQAFWGTQVRLEVVGLVPIVGERLARLLQGGDQLSAATLSRFYIGHVWVLSVALFGLIVAHLGLVTRHGISALPDEVSASDEWDPSK